MKSHVRTSAAAISLSHSTKSPISSIYSYDDGAYINISVSISGDQVEGYDYSNGCHVGGTLPNLYHYGESHHINLKETSNGKYDGYDYGTGSHFTISIDGNTAQVYDYGSSGYFAYSF